MAAPESYHEDFRLLPAVLDRKAQEDPNGVYACFPLTEDLADGFRDYTYREVLHAADALAQWLEATIGRSDSFETLSYVGVSDLRYVIFFHAAIKAGHKLLFFSPKNTVPQNAILIQNTQCAHLFFSKEYEDIADQLRTQTDLKDLKTLPLDPFEAWIPRYTIAKPFMKRHSEAQFDPIVVFHSSGSTGPPKTIVQNHQFFINGHRFPPLPRGKRGNFYDVYKFEKKSFITASFPFYHVAGFTFICLIPLFYETCSIACGVPNRPATPEAILQMLQVRRIRMLNTPPSIIEGILRLPGSEQYLKQLDTIIYAGGPLAKWAGNELSQHTNLVTNYGLTENGPVPLLLPDRENWQWMDFHPDLDLKWEPMYDTAHELVFEQNDKLHRYLGMGATILRSNGVFRSKDLFIPHPTKPGLWQFFGRNDDIIVLSSGLKYNPIPSEAIISAHPEVSGTIIAGTGLLQPVAVIERKSNGGGKSDAEFLASVWPTVQAANQQTQRYGQVKRKRIIIVNPRTFVRTPKGSTNRQASLRLLQGCLDELVNTTTSNGHTNGSVIAINSRDDLLPVIRECVLQESELERVDDDADFPSLSINSVDAAEIAVAIQGRLAGSFPEDLLHSVVRSEKVFRFPTISGLATALYNQLCLNDEPALSTHDVAQTLLQRYRIQALSISPIPKDDPNTPSVALSGTTGSLGSCLLKTLLHNSHWNKVICLNRSTDAERRTKLLLASLPDVMWSKVEFVRVEQNADRIGLTDDEVTHIQQCRAIIHCAWQVNFLHSLESFESQIKDLRTLAELAATAPCRPRLLFASSVSAVSRHTSGEIGERTYDDINVATTGYGQSKQVAERLLQDASSRYNLPITVLRIGQVAGYDPDFGVESVRTKDVLPQWNPGEWFPSIVKTSQTLLAVPDDFATIDWIPINVLSQIIVDVVSQDTSSGCFQVYNLVNPYISSWSTLFEPLREQMPDSLDIVPLQKWVELLKTASAKSKGDVIGLPASKLLAFIEDRSVAQWKRPEYRVDNAVQASQTMSKMRAISQRQIAFWIKQWSAS